MSILKNIESPAVTFQLVSQLNILGLKSLFTEIPPDPYINAGYRYKSLSRCRLNQTNLEKQPHTPLFQDRDTNPVNGGIARFYPEIPNLDDAKEAILLFAHIFGIDYSYEILVQAQRTQCSHQQIGITTPEGFHRDGIDFLAILCVAKYNIVGAQTQLANSQGKIVFKHTLSPGEMLLINDSQFLHYTSPITLKEPQLSPFGFRDVLIISSSRGLVNQTR
jgi:hypothetical protein